MHGVFLDRASLDRGDLDLGNLDACLDSCACHDNTDPADTLSHIGNAEVVISNKVVLDRTIIEACPKLKFIAIAATGTNNVDLEAARAAGIIVSNVRAYGTPAVMQHVYALMLALSTRLLDYNRAVRAGKWHQSNQFCLFDFPIREIAGRTLGIVGYGELGKAVAEMGRAFGMEVLIAARPGTEASDKRLVLDDLLPRVDVLSLHCPLTEETKNLISERELGLMKNDAILINTARGGIVDEAALAAALRAGTLGGAGFDVLTIEPPKDGNILLDDSIPNLIITPHIAWASRESRQRLLEQVAENILAFTRGAPMRTV